MYTQSHARAKINGVLHDLIEDEFGVNQVGPSSSNLFSKFLRDLRNYLNDEYGITISDDVVLLHLLI